jgi:hypothetical protein
VWRRGSEVEPEPAFDRQPANDLIRKIVDRDGKLNRVLEILEEDDEEEGTDADA